MMTFAFMLIIWFAVCLCRAGMLKDALLTLAAIASAVVLLVAVMTYTNADRDAERLADAAAWMAAHK